MTARIRQGRHRAGRKGRGDRLGGMVEIAVHTERLAWFTPDSLATYLQVSDRLIRKWVAEGRLRSYKLDGCRRFDPVDVDRFVAGLRDERRESAGRHRSAA
jgi:excisionase family DNA binding protein